MAEETERPHRGRWAIAIAVVALTLALLVPNWASSPTNAPAANRSEPAPAAHGNATADAEDAPRVRSEAAPSASRTITLIVTFAGRMPPPTVLEARCRVRPGDLDTASSITGDQVALQLPSTEWTQLDVALSGSNFMPSRQLVLPGDVDAEGKARVVVKPRSTASRLAAADAGARLRPVRVG